MEVIQNYGKENIATVFIARTKSGKLIEFVESFQPNLPIEKKWVLVLSVMHGCPVKCLMCDAGQQFGGNLSKEEILAQVDHIVSRRFPDRKIPTDKFKVQFTRMGEPAYNNAVLDVLEELPAQYNAPGLIPSVSTIAPEGRDDFFARLLEIKNKYYKHGKFQMQFSIHTTDFEKRDKLIPIKKWSFEQISEYGEKFFVEGDRKITLNFALMKDYPVEPKVIDEYFDSNKFLVKITPLNPTKKATDNNLISALDSENENSIDKLVEDLRSLGFDVIVSIGELEENQIGSNCGQFVTAITKIQDVQ
ncbi:radical SAM protein [Candidatus Micrarchaeota archaeon]|nr:radical SAM protein [Candidatus Micrarchaeota archaeon]